MFRFIKLKRKLEKYIQSNLEDNTKDYFCCEECSSLPLERKSNFSIDSYIVNNKEDMTFQQKLFYFIDRNQLRDQDVYHKVNIDRRLFSKIRSDINYHPSKETVILLGIALELNETEIEELLELSSYSLPKNNTYDLIIRFCFQEKIYNISTINQFLYDYHCKTLN